MPNGRGILVNGFRRLANEIENDYLKSQMKADGKFQDSEDQNDGAEEDEGPEVEVEVSVPKPKRAGKLPPSAKK